MGNLKKLSETLSRMAGQTKMGKRGHVSQQDLTGDKGSEVTAQKNSYQLFIMAKREEE